jgi:hypothetical protein
LIESKSEMTGGDGKVLEFDESSVKENIAGVIM